MSPSQPRKRVESAHKCKRPGGAQTPRGRHQEVSPDATPTLQALAFAARVQREAMKDKSYRSTPIGLEVGRDYRWKKNEWGATAETMRDYEAILGKLALDHADLEVSSFKPPVGTELLREFIDNRWGERTARTRAKVISVLRDFFGWAVREGRLHGNPALPIFRPRRRDVARGTFTEGDVRKLLTSQPRLRDRVALLLLVRLGLRKSELARVQFAHYDGRNLTVFGKGGKVRYLPVVDRQLREALERHILERGPMPDEFLLYPEKIGPEFYKGPRRHNLGGQAQAVVIHCDASLVVALLGASGTASPADPRGSLHGDYGVPAAQREPQTGAVARRPCRHRHHREHLRTP